MIMSDERIVERLRTTKFDIEVVSALMQAYEKAYMDFDVVPEERDRYESSVYAFYGIWAVIKNIAEMLDCANQV